MEQTPPKDNAAESWGWTRTQRIGLGTLLGILIVTLSIGYYRRPMLLGGTDAIVIDGQPVTLPARVDPNSATIQELARIPNVGTALASKILQYRDARKQTATDGVVFRQLSDLDPIPGVGKATLEAIGPFLQFPAPP